MGLETSVHLPSGRKKNPIKCANICTKLLSQLVFSPEIFLYFN